MTNLEIMQMATEYTTEIYKQVNYSTKVQSGRITYEGLKYYASRYTADCLRKVILSEDGICTDYPVKYKENLREKMAAIGKNGLINELLKNIVNVSRYLRMKEIPLAENRESSFSKNMTTDEMAVSIFNNIDYFGPEKAYSLLENPDILYVACVAFAKYRSVEFKDKMEYVSTADPEAKYLNGKLQEYYESLEAQKVKSLK